MKLKRKFKNEFMLEVSAVDGKKNLNLMSYKCSHTGRSTWWTCDMQAPYYIDYIIFYGRDEYGI